MRDPTLGMCYSRLGRWEELRSHRPTRESKAKKAPTSSTSTTSQQPLGVRAGYYQIAPQITQAEVPDTTGRMLGTRSPGWDWLPEKVRGR